MFANAHLRDRCGIKMVDFSNFSETNTDNVWLHSGNYTVLEFDYFPNLAAPTPLRTVARERLSFRLWGFRGATGK